MSPETTPEFLVTGAGAIGWTVAAQLADQGHTVTVLTRSGSGPKHPLVRRVRADVSDPAQLAAHFDGVRAVFHCIHGSAYTERAWRAELPRAERTVLDAAEKAGAVVVFPESLYSYSRPDQVMREDSPRDARGGKRGVRTELLTARAAHSAHTVSVVGSDYFGPRALGAHAGERMVPKVMAGKSVQVIGSTEQPHSFTYVPDFAAAMIAAARNEALWNRVLHAPTGPAVTQREMAQAFATAAGAPAAKVSTIPGWLMKGLGLAMESIRELNETSYQFTGPFVMDSSVSEELLGLAPTPLEQAAKETVDWWRGRP
ncbi:MULTISPECIES: NAD-dependent epimerase/dehydratase family protein [Arthrobacter]|uniref:NAD-dependent epimerase/dehydratase family protein n=2 Tax=Arthrobacter TaxID=1663 RepID=A0ABU9KMM9_9MICC|nr:NAD-dependent epimerase/dehydratase family protein [Arthrobacter sp. YJM1]MDP5228462.1 NAD-dependent epimerase/dehydratase family protein [Arthrobacter sp. YJM1]